MKNIYYLLSINVFINLFPDSLLNEKALAKSAENGFNSLSETHPISYSIATDYMKLIKYNL